MTWRDNLRPGSFRGVPFHTELAEQIGGRRLAVHEFPQRDDAVIEDLGRRPHQFTVDCFVLGAAYMAARDALAEALDQSGPGTLIHPYRGSVSVACLEWRCRETSAEGGYASFSIQFILAAAAQPSQSVDTAAVADGAASAAAAEAQTGFGEGFSVSGLPGFLASSAGQTVSDLGTRLEDGLARLQGARDAVTNIAAQAQALRADALSLVHRVPDLGGAIAGLIVSARLLANTPRAALRELQNLVGYSAGDRPPGQTPNRAIERSNMAAVERLVILTAAAEAVRAATASRLDSYDDAVDLRNGLADQLDEVAVRYADLGDDAAFQRLTDLRLAMVRDVTQRGGSLQRVYTYAPAGTEPALVIAHRLYANAGRAAEIVERNAIRHPGFIVGGRALEVLTDG